MYSNGVHYIDNYKIKYFDIDGNEIKKNKEEYPYNYDTYIVWKNDYKKGVGHVVYSDRLYQWDYNKFNICCKEVWGNKRQYFSDKNPEDIQKFLSLYFEKEIKLTAILEGCNASNGFPYWVFIFEDK